MISTDQTAMEASVITLPYFYGLIAQERPGNANDLVQFCRNFTDYLRVSFAPNIRLSTGWGFEMNNISFLNTGSMGNAAIQRATTTSTIGLGCTRDEVQSFAVRSHAEASMDSNLQMDVRRARKLRQLRKRIFGKHMFSGPGWEILLHLFEAHLSQLRDTVGNVCIGTELPSATTVRWIGRLEQGQLVSVRDDRFDRRRKFVELTDSGVRLMNSYFAGAAPHQITA